MLRHSCGYKLANDGVDAHAEPWLGERETFPRFLILALLSLLGLARVEVSNTLSLRLLPSGYASRCLAPSRR